jgi:hypothetical protein
MEDPATAAFSTPGPRELRFNLYEPDGVTLLRAEILRVDVVEIPAGLAVTGGL